MLGTTGDTDGAATDEGKRTVRRSPARMHVLEVALTAVGPSMRELGVPPWSHDYTQVLRVMYTCV